MAYQGLMLKTGIESYSPNHLDLLLWTSENHLLISSEHSASIKNVGDTLEAFIANRLIPLNKNPGIRPIGVGEVIRRIAGNVITDIAKKTSDKQQDLYKYVRAKIRLQKPPSTLCTIYSSKAKLKQYS